MDLKLSLLDTFPARGADGKVYKVCAYERLRRDETLADGQEHWLPTGVSEYRLDSGDLVDVGRDDALTVARSGLRLVRA
jgi:hypothetical protein